MTIISLVVFVEELTFILLVFSVFVLIDSEFNFVRSTSNFKVVLLALGSDVGGVAGLGEISFYVAGLLLGLIVAFV